MCGCRKSGQRNTTKGRPVVSPQRVAATRNGGVTPSQLQALALKIAEQDSKPKNDFEKRRVEKLRREAIRRSLGRR